MKGLLLMVKGSLGQPEAQIQSSCLIYGGILIVSPHVVGDEVERQVDQLVSKVNI